MYIDKEKLSNPVKRCVLTVSDKQFEFLTEKCVNKSELLRKLIEIRMQEPNMEL